MKLSVLVWVPGHLKRNPARLTKNGENFALMSHFTLKMLIQRQKICTRKSSYAGLQAPKFDVSSSSGSRDSRGYYNMLPSRVRNSHTFSVRTARVTHAGPLLGAERAGCLYPPLTWLLGHVATRGKRHLKKHKQSWRNCFRHFLIQVKCKVTRGQLRFPLQRRGKRSW